MIFARDKKTGALTQLAGTDACVSADGEGLLEYASDMALSPDGNHLYVVSSETGTGAVAVFARQKK